MSQSPNPYEASMRVFADQAAVDERSNFIVQTYLHLIGAIALFVGLETMLQSMPAIGSLVQAMIGSRISWLIVLGAFIGVSWLAESWALNSISPQMQYLGLATYVVAQSIIFAPLIYMARMMDPSGALITSAAASTGALFALMTAVVFITRKDFSFLGGILWFGGLAALGFIVCAVVFRFNPGPIFIYAMIAFACAYILYDTSNVLHRYRIGQHVAAALALFASVALLFWYILQLFMNRR